MSDPGRFGVVEIVEDDQANSTREQTFHPGEPAIKIIETDLPGVLILEPEVFDDERGFFLESFHAQRYREAGIDAIFVQDNQSRSRKGVLRGLHFQRKYPQGKLVRVSRGSVFDVTADIDPSSATFGKHVGITLSEDTHRQVWIPPGYAHGFCVLSDMADLQYKCTALYCPDDEAGVVWNDTQLDIRWPTTTPLLSAKDQHLPTLAELTRTA